MDTQMRRERVLSYLYGLMDESEAAAFRAEVDRDPALARLLAAEERFDQHLPVGRGPDVPEPLLRDSRLLLAASLRRLNRSRPSLIARMAYWLQEGVPRSSVAAGGAVALVLGILLGRGAFWLASPPATPAHREQVVDVRIDGFDAATGQVSIELTSLVTSSLQGRISDPRIQSTLSAALVGHLQADTRLNAVQLLRPHATGAPVRQALAEALLGDPNPGVRLAAAEALRAQGDEDAAVQRALRQALVHDDNPGVRLAAFEALQGRRDQETRQSLERAAYFESNPYIRAGARRALDGWNAAVDAHL